MRKLGKNQLQVLDALIKHGNWHKYKMCGWVWDNVSNTKRILDSLVDKELVRIYEDNTYEITQKGKDIIDILII